jgi:general secretion pathway protein L
MRIDVMIWRWLEVLAALFLAWREQQRQRRSLIIRQENGSFVVRHGEPERDAIIRDAQSDEGSRSEMLLHAGSALPADLVRDARDRFIVLELPADKIITRRMQVPAQAQEFLAGVVANQIERLSPWPVDQVVYGFASDVGKEEAGALEVSILLSPRAEIDSVRDELAQHVGLEADRIVARRSDRPADHASGLIPIWSRLADISPDSLQGMRRRIGLGVAAAIGMTIALSAWALISASSLRDQNEALAARSRVLQRQIQAGHNAASLASLPPAERAWAAKESSALNVVTIEVLSRALPDSAYLTELHLESGTLRIVGLAVDAPALLAPLEASGSFSNVRLFAPTTRGPDGRLSRFNIEARVEPHSKRAKD